GREIRHAEIDADDTFAADARIDRARRAREPQLAVGQMSSGGDEARNAARTVAALLDLAAVRVEDPVSGVARAVVGERDEQKLVEADAEAAVRETPHDVRFRSGSLPRPIDDHEVVAETVHFREADLHACRVRGWQARASGHGPRGRFNVARALQTSSSPSAGAQVYVESPWPKPQKTCRDLRDFLALLESRGELKRVSAFVDPKLELTEVSRRTLARSGPALLFDDVGVAGVRALTNLFGTESRIVAALGAEGSDALPELGRLLAALKAPEPPRSVGEAFRKLPLLKEIVNMAPRVLRTGHTQEVRIEGADVDLGAWPIQTCWPEDAGPLITWGLTTTRAPGGGRQNLGVYRQQVIGRNKVIMRWLAHRGGATDYAAWRAAHPNEPFPVAVSIGADPATILAAVTPIP